jgi:hypothetical protein
MVVECHAIDPHIGGLVTIKTIQTKSGGRPEGLAGRPGRKA